MKATGGGWLRAGMRNRMGSHAFTSSWTTRRTTSSMPGSSTFRYPKTASCYPCYSARLRKCPVASRVRNWLAPAVPTKAPSCSRTAKFHTHLCRQPQWSIQLNHRCKHRQRIIEQAAASPSSPITCTGSEESHSSKGGKNQPHPGCGGAARIAIGGCQRLQRWVPHRFND